MTSPKIKTVFQNCGVCVQTLELTTLSYSFTIVNVLELNYLLMSLYTHHSLLQLNTSDQNHYCWLFILNILWRRINSMIFWNRA